MVGAVGGGVDAEHVDLKGAPMPGPGVVLVPAAPCCGRDEHAQRQRRDGFPVAHRHHGHVGGDERG